MSEMIERVMSAIAANLDVEPEGQWTREAARAAIASMREPTKEMVHAGCISLRTGEAQDQLMAASLSSWPFDLPRTKQRIRFCAMIDAALGVHRSP